MKTISLSDEVQIPVEQYASQGNAILGIRDTGKSYSATLLAENLLDASIPIVAFDPIGIWRFLKVPGKGNGYAVVVAGGESGDIPLTPESAPGIVKAAMQENVPLVLDLYSMELSKADWKRIVETCVRTLLYENKKFGLRHIFIEEAAEFCPQRVGPDSGRVYAEIEKLARMGGNASLGYTLINQRAEEVNKAVLELCDCLFLHRQKGRHSLTALGKWLDVADASSSREIIKSLPSLAQGECWVWQQGSKEPARVKMPQKSSFHPDRRKPAQITHAIHDQVSVDAFVAKIKSALPAVSKLKDKSEPRRGVILKDYSEDLQRENEQLREQIDRLTKLPAIDAVDLRRLELLFDEFKERMIREIRSLTHGLSAERVVGAYVPSVRNRTRVVHHQNNGEAPSGGIRRMLVALAQRPQGLSAKQLGVRSGLSSKSGTFATYLGSLRGAGQIEGGRDRINITKQGIEALGDFEELPVGAELRRYWLKELGSSGASKMLEVLIGCYPTKISAQYLAEQSGLSSSSGTFATYLGRLRSLELAEGSRQALRASEELFA